MRNSLAASLVVRHIHADSQSGETGTHMTVMTTPIGTTPSGQRSFSVAYRVEFLQAWDASTGRGDKARLLRANNLTYPTVKNWITARDTGALAAAMVQHGRKRYNRMANSERAELAQLRRENTQLRAKVKQAEAAQDILGKAFELLEEISKSSNDHGPHIPPELMSAEQYRQWLDRQKLS